MVYLKDRPYIIQFFGEVEKPDFPERQTFCQQVVLIKVKT